VDPASLPARAEELLADGLDQASVIVAELRRIPESSGAAYAELWKEPAVTTEESKDDLILRLALSNFGNDWSRLKAAIESAPDQELTLHGATTTATGTLTVRLKDDLTTSPSKQR
jgi:hypothetical protein